MSMTLLRSSFSRMIPLTQQQLSPFATIHQRSFFKPNFIGGKIGLTVLNKLSTFVSKESDQWATSPDLSPEAQEKYDQLQGKIRTLATRAGIRKPECIKIIIHLLPQRILNINSLFYSLDPLERDLGVSPFLIFPSKEQLPEDLKLERLERKEMTEEEWALNYICWLYNDFNKLAHLPVEKLGEKEKMALILFGKEQLEAFADPKKFEKKLKALILHELGHIYHEHGKIRILSSIFSTLSLGLYDRFIGYHHYRVIEKEADLFAARFSKEAKEGLIELFKESQQRHLKLKHLVSYEVDGEGNVLNDPRHPFLSERIAYLEALEETSEKEKSK